MKLLRTLLTFLLVALLGNASALTPPRPGELEQLRASGELPGRMSNARLIGNHQLDPASIPALQHRLNQALGKVPLSAPPPAWGGGLPASGSPKVLVLLVDFGEYPASGVNTSSYIANKMFGIGGAGVSGYPYESLTAFYKRASYNALNIGGTVTSYYRAQFSRSYYQNLGFGAGNTALINEALTALQNAGHDFTQYDSNGDGRIDTLFIKWTGPDNGWANFWWAYQSYYQGSLSVDGVRAGKFIWSWTANTNYDGESTYNPRVDIHETGHALGLPDYYDYDVNVGPDGGVGGLDMMAGNWGDHGAFSKFVLGWLNPTIITSGSSTLTLNPTGSAAHAVLFMPGATSGNPFGEFFLAQYRRRGVQNDPTDYPTDGIVLWHVDARLNGSSSDYLYDNSYTSHKLLRLVQADGLAQIENNSAPADAGDFYTSSRSFGPSTNPNSNNYAGASTGASMTSIGTAGTTIAATFGVGGGSGFTLNVTKSGSGTGTVTSSPSGINCGSTCSAQFNSGTTVTLTALASSGSSFTGWSGSCTGVSSTCTVTMSAARSVSATFTPATSAYSLSVTKTGTGIGTVTSSPTGISCGSTCSAQFVSGTTVTLSAVAASGSSFAGWGGACSGVTSTCVVSMSAARSVTATFNVTTSAYVLSVTKAGTGSGTVVSSPSGISCGNLCSAQFNAGTLVTLSAIASAGSTFSGWSGACSGTSSTCMVSMSAARSVIASFTSGGVGYTLSVSKAGTGSGTVTSSPSGISCGSTCSASYPSGTIVTMSAIASAGSTFTGWSGACSGTSSTCMVSMTAARSVTASFTAGGSTYSLSVSKSGTGSGTVTSSPSGISCGSVCSASFASGTTVILSAGASSGSTFTGWGGACTGSSSSCTVSMTAARSVTASFAAAGGDPVLTLFKAGTGTGSVKSISVVPAESAGSNVAPIVGGTPATLGAWPWQVGLVISGTGGSWMCGGSLLSSRWIVTAAHCVRNGASTVAPSAISIRAGSINFSSGGQTYAASSVIAHGSYNDETKDNDIALIQVSSDVTVSNSSPIRPLLPTQETSLAPNGALATVTGWGTTSSGGSTSPVLMQVQVPVQTSSTCASTSGYGSAITSNMICAGYAAGGKDSCQGDSGGPLVVSNGQGGYVLAGVVSWGNECALPGYPGVYTRVANYRSWLQSNTGLNFDAGIDCGTTCSSQSATFPLNSMVTLQATPASGSTFAGWSGACSGTASTCTVSMSAARTVTASFAAGGSTYTLSVSKAGTGSGTVTSSPSGISCGSTCSASFASGTTVTLSAIASAGSTFSGWSGACSGTSGTCLVSMSAARSVVASFTSGGATYTLSVSRAGTGSGTVTSSPSGISCGSTCSASYASGATVTLSAVASAGSSFAGWGGSCAGSASTCSVSMTAARSVSATFNVTQSQARLSVYRSGSGAVVSTPAGISCGTGVGACTAMFAGGTSVTLSATASSGWTFAGWSGGCSGSSASCTVSMSTAKAVMANFTVSSLGTALESSTLPWSTSGAAAWFSQSSVWYSGGSAAQSGAIAHNQTSSVRTTVTGPGLLRFWWRTSTESGYDWLGFQFNGWDQLLISGETAWQEQVWFIPDGTHALSWVYRKDGSDTAGSDAVWLDKVSFTPGTAFGSAGNARNPVAGPVLVPRTVGGNVQPKPAP